MLKTLYADQLIEIVFDGAGEPQLKANGQGADIEKAGPKYLKIQRDGQLFHVILEGIDHSEKTVFLRINGEKRAYKMRDEFDEKLEKLGMAEMGIRKFNELKSPMPGLVINIAVEPGSEVKKGDPLIVLEAMKMENILRSPGDVKVKEIKVQKGAAVEKNKVLITFE
ncbi:MAG: biotin attachment protein [Bacteroidia bacterium]|nr:biotin attachment protein [Bacteroidia bacterium]